MTMEQRGPITIAEMLNQVPSQFGQIGHVAKGAVLQLKFEGEGGGNYYVEVTEDGSACSVETGEHPDPMATIEVGAADFLAMARGEARGQRLYMDGKLRFTGDVGLAVRLQALFRRPPIDKEESAEASA